MALGAMARLHGVDAVRITVKPVRTFRTERGHPRRSGDIRRAAFIAGLFVSILCHDVAGFLSGSPNEISLPSGSAMRTSRMPYGRSPMG